MPVQTRAAGQPQASKVYKAAAPEPKQQHFPNRRRQVKTYGRRTTSKYTNQTLTQMNFVSSAVQEEVQPLSDSEDDQDDQNEAEKPVVAPKNVLHKRSSQKSSRSTRRRTMGDVDKDLEHEKPRDNKRRRTMGDLSDPSSNFHTQTLTQFLSSTSKDEDDWNIPDSGGEGDLGIVKETPKKQKANALGLQAPQLLGANSVTPSNRMTKMEIPSSQSPATPILLRYSPAKEPSPLKNRSTNMASSQSTSKTGSKISRNLVIQDSYSTTHSSPITPTPKAKAKAAPLGTVTPAKKLRFELPEDKENITPGRTKPKSPKPASQKSSQRQPLSEVPDSDDEFDETENEDNDLDVLVAESPTRIAGRRSAEVDIVIATDADADADIDANVDADEADDENDGHYAAGAETQAFLISSGNRSSLKRGVVESPGIFSDAITRDQEESVDKHESISNTFIATQGDDEIVEQTPTTTICNYSEEVNNNHEEYTQGFTQGMESQRVPLETIKATGPITDRSDIVISIYGQHVENIVARTKTHEFRDWKFPESVHRVWIYITRPTSELRYMCIFGPPKTAGEIDEDGIGNAEFNKGMKRSKFAYEVLNMFELNNPVSLRVMKQNGWPTAPQKFSYVPPAVVGQLTSNLRCALWDEEEGEEEERGVIQSNTNVTESQELADQIRSDVDHVTQLEFSDHTEVIPSSQSPPRTLRKRATSRNGNAFVRPAPPKTLPASSSRSFPRSHSQQSGRGLRASQATTVSQFSSSSPHTSPEKSLPLPPMLHAQRAAPISLPNTSSPTSHRHSLRSSQFPTKSQMLPDSLLNGDIQEPPPIIWDSADDESD